MRNWKRIAESEAVAEGVPPAMPRWEGGVPCCRYDDCVHYDGKRCELLGERPSSLCEPVVAGMASDLERTRRALNAVLAVLAKGPRYTDRHLEAAADSVVEEISEAIALASGETGETDANGESDDGKGEERSPLN